MPHLTIVIATFNEARRLPATLTRMAAALRDAPFTHDVLIVDDGSVDETVAWVQSHAANHPEVSCLARSPNQGRGAAIRHGVLHARGDIILETDADGSVDDEALFRFMAFFADHPDVDVLFGSRQLPDSRIVQWQPPLRVALGYGFLYLARAVLRSPRSTEFTLGFKMFRRAAAQDIFSHQFDDRYVAEAEIVHVARLRGWRSRELAVTWTDNRDSRVKALRDSARSLQGMAGLLAREARGRYGNP